MYWVEKQLAQRKGLKFYRAGRTQSSSTLPAYCMSTAIVMTSETRKCMCHIDHHRRFPTKNNCTCDLDSNVARNSKDIQRIELKPNTQLSNTRRLVTRWREETLERTKFDRDTLNQEKHDKVTDPTSTVKLVSGHESTKRCVLTPRHVENDQTGTGKPVTVDMSEFKSL